MQEWCWKLEKFRVFRVNMFEEMKQKRLEMFATITEDSSKR
jgi:hypothetical protein